MMRSAIVVAVVAALLPAIGLAETPVVKTSAEKKVAPAERKAPEAAKAAEAAKVAEASDAAAAEAKAASGDKTDAPPEGVQRLKVEAAAKAGDRPAKETDCDDGIDNDGDSMVDCADADCVETARCQPGGGLENSNARCSDWIDNDGDGAMDCDDSECEGPGVTVCQGSWKGPLDGNGAVVSGAGSQNVPELREGMSVEDLLGKGGDNDGERNNVVCSDGIDNDGDGKIDCADLGCRFDSSVTVCHGNPGMRFSIVGMVGQAYTFKEDAKPQEEGTFDTRFTRLQLRSFGPIPMIQNSFYLLSLRTEKTPRMTFAMFQIPLGNSGHRLNINSGGGGLSVVPVIGAGKHLLVDPAYYVTSAFQGGNGAAAELLGPIGDGTMFRYRAYAAGGSGRFTGNIGGRYFSYGKTNYTYSIGGQLQTNIVGNYSPWDSSLLYTAVPMTFSVLLGAKFDQRATERFPAAHTQLLFRNGRLTVRGEAYYKLSSYEYLGKVEDFSALAYNVEAGFLVWPKKLLLAADYGAFVPGAKLEEVKDSDLKRQLDEMQWRVAMHYYFLRRIGIVSLVYSDRTVRDPKGGDALKSRKVNLIAQYRF